MLSLVHALIREALAESSLARLSSSVCRPIDGSPCGRHLHALPCIFSVILPVASTVLDAERQIGIQMSRCVRGSRFQSMLSPVMETQISACSKNGNTPKWCGDCRLEVWSQVSLEKVHWDPHVSDLTMRLWCLFWRFDLQLWTTNCVCGVDLHTLAPGDLRWSETLS